MTKTAFHLEHPKDRTTSVVFASPHSGRNYPWSFLRKTVLDEHTVRSSEDAFVDQLFSEMPGQGAPLLTATAPRAFIDLNRSIDELDPALIREATRQGHNPRISSGLGVIPRVVANGRSIYRGKISLGEAQKRIDEFWRPYHNQLQNLLSESLVQFGEAILIDCHSMPHEAIEGMSPAGVPNPEIVLGDRFGSAASAEIVERIEAAFASEGLRVARNTPFAGAYIAQHYGRPTKGQHVVQIEIDRSLYLDEVLIKPNRDFDTFRRLITRVGAEIADIGRQKLAVAAE